MTEEWSSETPYTLGDPFFHSLKDAIDRASHSIDLEMYIFASDETGVFFAEALSLAATRGIAVRVIVDGVGSLGWISRFGDELTKAGAAFKVYHPLPWEERIGRAITEKKSGKLLMSALSRLNKRTHRKLVVIDEKIAFVGSRNISSVHSERLSGESAWNDLSVRVEGDPVIDLKNAFQRLWEGKVRGALKARPSLQGFPELVHLNDTRSGRRKKYFDLIRRITSAEKRVWIVSSYFVPPRSLLKALASASDRGRDVRILVPFQSDVFFIPWIISSFQFGLLKAGVKLFEYSPSVLHAKYMIIDDWLSVGSSNLNHRSIFHDLEVDVRLKAPATMEAVTGKFISDIAESYEVTLEVWRNKSISIRALGRILLLFKNLL